MATVTKNLGIVTAYGYALSAGYTGTEDEFAELMLGSKGYYDKIVELYDELANENNYIEARSWAVGDTETRDGEETDNSKYYAQQAAASADAAAESETNAATSESNAKAYAAAASGSSSEVSAALGGLTFEVDADDGHVTVSYTAD